MKISLFRKTALFLIVGLGLAVTPNSKAVTYTNCNFGLLPGEQQFLAVNNPSSALVDQFNYVVTGPFDYTTAKLKQGVAYDIRISGRVGIGPRDGSNNSTPDAAYTFVNWQNLDLVHVPGTDGMTWVTHWDGISGRRPSPDVYSTAHVYDYYVEGQGAGLSLSFRDTVYGDNIGGFQVSLFELGAIQSPLTDGLVAYYPFNGNVNDETINANNGTANNAVLTTDRFGQPNSAYAFNGVNAYISAPNKEYLTFPNNGDFTISVWAALNRLPTTFPDSFHPD